MKSFTVLLLFCFMWAPEVAQAKTVQSFSVSDTLLHADSQTVRTTLDIVFDTVPAHYWIYYDTKKTKLALDMYGDSVHIKKDAIQLSDKTLFTGAQIFNLRTKLSLSQNRSIIFTDVENGWHFSAATISDTLLRITAEKDLFLVPRKNEFGLHILIPIASAFILGGIAAIVITNSNTP